MGEQNPHFLIRPAGYAHVHSFKVGPFQGAPSRESAFLIAHNAHSNYVYTHSRERVRVSARAILMPTRVARADAAIHLSTGLSAPPWDPMQIICVFVLKRTFVPLAPKASVSMQMSLGESAE